MQNEPKYYRLPFETIPGLDLSSHLEDLIAFQNFLEDRGIETNNTRIARYGEYLKKTLSEGLINGSSIFKSSAEGPFQHATDWLLYVLREVHELMWILKGVKAYSPPGVDEKLRVIVGGSDFAALDSDSRSRNAQFELRIASYFCQAGCKVDLSNKTDIVALTNDEAFYLECKRVGSSTQLAKRLSEAKKQLISRMPTNVGKRVTYGCVAVDVTRCAFVHNGLTWGVTNEHSRDVIQEKLEGIANAAQRLLALFRGCPDIFGYWLQIHIPSLILQPPTTVTRFSSCHIFRDGMRRKERRAAKSFIEIFKAVSTGDERETPSKSLTLRKTFTFPNGTTFHLDEDLFLEFLEHGDIKKREINDEVATITINVKEHLFSSFDFSMAITEITDAMRQEMAKNRDRARLDLVVRMYIQRFPYEESDS